MSEAKQQSLPPGYRLAEFEIIRELGSGGFGITYLARDQSLDREVVIKENLPLFAFRDPNTSTVYPKTSKGEDADLFAWSLESFVREAKTLAKFDHPNIVKILRVFDANGTAYFVMPYVEGRTFSEWIAQRKAEGEPFSEEELRALLLPLLDALEALHSQQVYHRDIKPGNVLITTKGTPMLIDFGAARQMVSERSHTVVESPGYTPFEQLQSRGNVGPWSDLYGLAATFYKALTFENPPKANDRVKKDAITKLAEDDVLRARLSHELLTSLDAALAFDEEGRPQTSVEMVRLLEERSAAEEESGNADLKTVSLAFAEGEAGEEYVPADVPSKPPLDSVAEECAEESISAVASELKKSRGRSGPQNQGTQEKQGSQRSEGLRRKVLVTISAFGLLIALIVTMKAIVVNPGTKTSASEDRSLRPTPSTPSPVVRPATAPPAATTTKVVASSAPAPSTPAPESRDMEGRRAGEVREFAGIEMVWCPPGEFLMGSPESEEGREDDETQRRVTLTQGFWIAKTECTQTQWDTVTGENPSEFKGDYLPVETVSWEEVDRWLEKMNEKIPYPTSWKWSLPTEAQWEYACRAGTDGLYAGAGELSEMGWYDANAGKRTAKVATKMANAWGLHDMHGNVFEWCRDGFGTVPSGAVTDPICPATDSYRVIRGGSFNDIARRCRSSSRYAAEQGGRGRFVGFRPALVPSSTASTARPEPIASTKTSSQSKIQTPIAPPAPQKPPSSSSTASIIVEILNSKAMYSMFDYYGITSTGYILYDQHDPINDPRGTDNLTIFDIKSREIIQTFRPAGNSFSISPDGTLFAGHTMSLDNKIEVHSADAKLFDRAFNEYVKSTDFSEDSKYLAVVCLYSIHIIDVKSRKVVASVKATNTLGSSCFSTDGKTLVVSDDESLTVILLDVATRKMTRIKFPEERLGEIWRVDKSDKIYITGSEHFYQLDIPKKQLQSFIDHRTYPMDLSESGRYAGVDSSDGITIFDMISGASVFNTRRAGGRLGIVLDEGTLIIENEATDTHEALQWK